LQLVCGTTSLGYAKLPGDAQIAMGNLTSLIGRRLAQAKDGAAGFQHAIANELLELKQSALAVDADIKVLQKTKSVRDCGRKPLRLSLGERHSFPFQRISTRVSTLHEFICGHLRYFIKRGMPP
jgi:hypothetical protein